LTILLLGLIFGIDKQLIQFHIETYNNKVNGINKTLKKENKSMKQIDSMEIAKEFQIIYSTHTPFIMVRFIESFKFILDKDKFDFTWGVGSSVSGKTDEDKNALLLYKHINLNDSFNKLRNGSTTQIFKDFYKEGKDYVEGRYECFLLKKASGTVDFFHPLSAIFPFPLFMNVDTKRKNQYSNDNLYELNKCLTLESEVIRFQQYVISIRYKSKYV
jgi:hypothetical protein